MKPAQRLVRVLGWFLIVALWGVDAWQQSRMVERFSTALPGTRQQPSHPQSSLQSSLQDNHSHHPSATSTATSTTSTTATTTTLLSQTLPALSDILQGKGRAQACWTLLRQGVDPYHYNRNDHHNHHHNHRQDHGATLGKTARALLWHNNNNNTRTVVSSLQPLEAVASVTKVTRTRDGTTKLLIELRQDGKFVETVLIPQQPHSSNNNDEDDSPDDDDDDDKSSNNNNNNNKMNKTGRTTVCISSQVGCRQACTFCLTGRMGLLRNLSADEILMQVFLAQQYCDHSSMQPRRHNESHETSQQQQQQQAPLQLLPPIDNIVFMGQGEPADNADAVVQAATALADPHRFGLAPRKITISTVAPNPQSFAALARAPAVLAWSVHASRDDVRRRLVPTTRHTMVDLRDGLIDQVLAHPNTSERRRGILIEWALLDGINDGDDDARHLVDFCRAFPGKVVINLIPWNDIQVSSGPAADFRRSPRVREFQQAIRDAVREIEPKEEQEQQGSDDNDNAATTTTKRKKRQIQCFVRTTRGDDELAACGQLSTKFQSSPR